MVRKTDSEVVIASQDVVGLYPNLDINHSAKICSWAIQKSEIKYQGVDYLWAAKYIAMSLSPTEIEADGLADIIPVRKFKPGTRPGITSKEAQDKKKDSLAEMRTSKWQFKKMRFNEAEERGLLAKVVEILVRTTFKHHLYQFEGQFYIQGKGGSIGLRLTGVVATLVMNFWGDEFDKLMRRNSIVTYLNRIYVDDQNLMLKALETGTKWTGDKMEWKEEWQRQDEEANEETDKRSEKWPTQSCLS